MIIIPTLRVFLLVIVLKLEYLTLLNIVFLLQLSLLHSRDNFQKHQKALWDLINYIYATTFDPPRPTETVISSLFLTLSFKFIARFFSPLKRVIDSEISRYASSIELCVI